MSYAIAVVTGNVFCITTLRLIAVDVVGAGAGAPAVIACSISVNLINVSSSPTKHM